ncbi:hypothetical protein RFI_00061 [Reticulomyxa filosa]|uniref:TRAF-type domain-containing protein n=1 Tax=Reticulomyxa filosa TaxID=46433 RepID=X6PFL0_RETFI|nr:hypothetical protein RFI_00061 [Reticulomyxa filosa]|eukprot:ETO37001.1 hypothetical protein RFI_00061 [Reticulomyxa filosa]
MKSMEDKKGQGLKIEAVSDSFEQQCFDRKWVLKLNDQEYLNNFTCLICRQIVNSPVEINCPQHDNLEEALVVGESCLTQFLNTNNNSCPIQPHENCRYYKIKSMQKQISNLSVMCPRQFQEDIKTVDYRNEKEGQTVGMTICNFKGKLREVNEHLKNDCPLKFLNCWFKPFGCDHICPKYELEDHLTADMKMHFELVTKSFNSLQQTIQFYQVCIFLVFFFFFFKKKKK